MKLLAIICGVSSAIVFYLWVSQGTPVGPRSFKQDPVRDTFATHHTSGVEATVPVVIPSPTVEGKDTSTVGEGYMKFRGSFPKIKDAQ